MLPFIHHSSSEKKKQKQKQNPIHIGPHILFLSKSSMHLFMCAIHSCFSVLVAAYTANDFVVVRISQPFRYSVSKLQFVFFYWILTVFNLIRINKSMAICCLYFFIFLVLIDDLRPLSSNPCSCTSSNGIMCCLLYFFLPITILPYTRISLNKKNCLAFGRLRHIFVRTPSPTRTRPGIANGWLIEKRNNFLIIWRNERIFN